MASDHVVKFRAELDNLFVVRPGDKLVVCVSRPLTSMDADIIKQRVAQTLPGVEAVVIMCDGLAVYRPDGPTTDEVIDQYLADPEHERIISEALNRKKD